MTLLTRSHVRRFFTGLAKISTDFPWSSVIIWEKNPLKPPTQVSHLWEVNAQIKNLVGVGHFEAARKLFDEMPQRDVISWTNIISGYVKASNYDEALHLFSRMCVEPCISLDPFVLSIVFKACGLNNSLFFGKILQGICVKNGLVKSVFVGSALVDMYAKCGDISGSCLVFDEMPEKNVVSWTAIITGLVKTGHCKEGLMYFSEMWSSGLHCDTYSFAIALKACADLFHLKCGKEIHTQAIKKGFVSSSYVANTIATMYNKCGKLDYGMYLFGIMRTPDVVGWTSLITSYVQMGKEDIAVQQFLRLRGSEVKPNEYTFAAVITACAHLNKPIWGEQLHAHVISVGSIDALSVANSVMTLYSRCGKLKSASLIFQSMATKDIVSWSSIITGYSQAGYGKEAFDYFSRMRREGPKPTEFAFSSLLSVSGSMAILEQGRQLHAFIMKVGLGHTSLVQSALITMYSKCGSISDASQIYSGARKDDVVSWTSMVNGFAEHGDSLKALELFDKMLQDGLKPDGVTFVGVLSACSHVGLVDLGYHYFNSMTQKFQISPYREHYGCMIDLLCRAGRLTEAEAMINFMPYEVDEVIWTTLLRACRIHGDVERGRRAAERILANNPHCAGTLTSLASIYCAKGKWKEAADIRKLMRFKGVVKKVGASWIKVKNEVSTFVSGD
ncbi:putative pentatricopeptide repeat-containing protein At3g47840 [Amaranthus tricolor]|uniref:putative pentatricopeptide repeat-containing protein At3g47840 n=1 Tax=Amaranthus tricolor TaxID=29722 RepID=UPI002585A7CC|nr:putative pentatricopeptide repeat-containing protein At3g47840 [Amaranthus tricolor]XP_057525589.1 putative pentatricopeptide repeat-containing protein At3g47840 [Amaranthus tricolor]XP_057525590.1 putative pentatricopeptide repeat-containing protein At3g47840 [Amaranthus tricolor]